MGVEMLGQRWGSEVLSLGAELLGLSWGLEFLWAERGGEEVGVDLGAKPLG